MRHEIFDVLMCLLVHSQSVFKGLWNVKIMYLFEFCKFFKKLLKYFTYAVCDFCTPSAYCPGECGERSVNIRNKK